MIVDTLRQAGRYVELHPLFRPAFEYLAGLDPAKIEPGTYELQGADLYVIISRPAPQRPAHALLEAHRKYIDLQVTLTGSFNVGWRPLAECRQVSTAYDIEKDAMLFNDPPEFRIALGEGTFAIFFPEDAHAPETSHEELVKAVFKIAV